jgi:hypothetical protein
VWPSPNSTVDSYEYAQSLARDSFLLGDIGIGAKLLAHRIAEEGDIDVDWVERTSLLVNEVALSKDSKISADGLVLHETYTTTDDGQRNLLYRVGGPYYLAWYAPLEPGEHNVTFQLRLTSGEVLEYNWRFVLVP